MSDVISIATRRYIATTPHATAPGRHADASGTRISDGPNSTYESATSAVTCVAVNTTDRPPRWRWSTRNHLGEARP
jgi:hypothetical protein